MPQALSDQSKIRLLSVGCVLLAIALIVSINSGNSPLRGQVSPTEMPDALEGTTASEVASSMQSSMFGACSGASDLQACIRDFILSICDAIPRPISSSSPGGILGISSAFSSQPPVTIDLGSSSSFGGTKPTPPPTTSSYSTSPRPTPTP